MQYPFVVNGKEIPNDVASPLIIRYLTVVKEMDVASNETHRESLRAELRGFFQGVALSLHVNSLNLENAVRFYLKQDKEIANS